MWIQGIFDQRFLIPSHTLTNFEIWTYYSRDNLPDKIRGGAYVINLDKYYDIGTHWIALYTLNNKVTYSDSFGVEHIPNKVKIFIGNKNIETIIFRIQAHDSVMCGFFCTGFIDFMLKGKILTDFTTIFSLNNLKKNDDIILNYFKNRY